MKDIRVCFITDDPESHPESTRITDLEEFFEKNPDCGLSVIFDKKQESGL